MNALFNYFSYASTQPSLHFCVDRPASNLTFNLNLVRVNNNNFDRLHACACAADAIKPIFAQRQLNVCTCWMPHHISDSQWMRQRKARSFGLCVTVCSQGVTFMCMLPALFPVFGSGTALNLGVAQSQQCFGLFSVFPAEEDISRHGNVFTRICPSVFFIHLSVQGCRRTGANFHLFSQVHLLTRIFF